MWSRRAPGLGCIKPAIKCSLNFISAGENASSLKKKTTRNFDVKYFSEVNKAH